MKEILGHKNLRQKFTNLIQKNQFPQTSLFYGTGGSGKKMVAKEVSQTLLCESPNFKDYFLKGCGKCQSCLLFEKEQHPDFYLIQAENTSKEKESFSIKPKGKIKVEQVTQVRSKIQYHPMMSDYQIVLIDDAELMTTTTANSLLKILEEPRPHQIFILVTSQFHHILLTIRSRSSKFFFKNISADYCKTIVQDLLKTEDGTFKEDMFEFYSSCFPGAPALIYESLKLPLNLRSYQKVLDTNSFLEANKFVKLILDNQIDINLFLYCLNGYILYLMKKNQKTETTLINWLDKIKAAQRQLGRHIQKDFVLENLFV